MLCSPDSACVIQVYTYARAVRHHGAISDEKTCVAAASVEKGTRGTSAGGGGAAMARLGAAAMRLGGG